MQILDYVGEVDYKGVNVLTSNELRQGIKEYFNWPTIPQLYVKGEFVGGCDIIREMFQSGEPCSRCSTIRACAVKAACRHPDGLFLAVFLPSRRCSKPPAARSLVKYRMRRFAAAHFPSSTGTFA